MKIIVITTSSIVSTVDAANSQTMKSLMPENKDNQFNINNQWTSGSKISWLENWLFFVRKPKDSHPAWSHPVGVLPKKAFKMMHFLKTKSVPLRWLPSWLIIDGIPQLEKELWNSSFSRVWTPVTQTTKEGLNISKKFKFEMHEGVGFAE